MTLHDTPAASHPSTSSGEKPSGEKLSAPSGEKAVPDQARLEALLAELTLEEKVQLITGRDFWTTWPIEKIGLRRMLFSDGPSGVRGELWDERDPSLNLPSATALGSSWDRSIAARYGAAAAVEARRKGVDVVLGPTINLHRSPLGGRHFEAFSEDPVLTSELAAAYVTGVQQNGVAATPKHYIANDSETDRFTVDARVEERPLRELYLLAFEKAVVEARAWALMSSYNSINGVTASENDLLETPLNSEWGFDGVVVSDWTGVRSLASASASQDLAMPGPDGPWGDALVEAIRDGRVAEASVDRKVLRLLSLAARVGALEGFDPAVSEPALVEDGVAFVREASAAGSVLLTNSGELPWNPAAVSSLAVIGHNARHARTQGGGSATVIPASVISPEDGLRAALPNASISYSIGAVVQKGIAELPLATLVDPLTGEPGMRVRFVDGDGADLLSENRRSTSLVWFGGGAPIGEASGLICHTTYTPTETGTVYLGFSSVGHGRVFVDGRLVVDEEVESEGTDLGAALLSPPSRSAAVDAVAGVPIDIRSEFDLTERSGPLASALSFALGLEPDDSDPDQLIAAAAQAAAEADVALVVVGTNSTVESEGFDRESLALPGRQDDLVRAVAAANPRTVVVVNAGSPVLLPWRDDVAAVLVGYFGGQEFGNAIADILTGATEPGGRLPTTWPASESDVPVLNTTPTDGALEYSEGIHIGYRAWLKAGTAPAYEFGHGLGYTRIEVTDASAPSAFDATSAALTESIPVEVTLANTGGRAGKQVVQVYVEKAGSAVDRAARWLVGFEAVHLEAGETARVTVSVPAKLLAYWDSGWVFEPGAYTLRVGTSVSALPLAVELDVTA